MGTQPKETSEFSRYLVGVTRLRQLDKELKGRGRKPVAQVQERLTLLESLDKMWRKMKTVSHKFAPIHRRVRS